MALFSILVDIAAKTADLEEGVKRVESNLDHMAGIAKAAGEALAGAFAFSTLKDNILQAVEMGDAYESMAKKTGIAASTISELSFVAKTSNVDLESLSNGIKKMQENISKGNNDFALLGINLQMLKTLSPEKQFEMIGDAISRIKDPADRTRAAVDLFGKAGTDLLPIFAEGADGIQKWIDKSHDLGVAMSDDMIKQLAQAKESVEELDAAWAAMWGHIAVFSANAAKGLGIIATPEIESIKNQLSILSRDRNSMIATLQNENGGFLKAILGKDYETNQAAFKKQIFDTEAAISQLQTKLDALQNPTSKPPIDGFDAQRAQAAAAAAAALQRSIATNAAKPIMAEFTSGSTWLDDYSKSLDTAQTVTQTSTEKILQDWATFDANLKLLQNAGADSISSDEALKRNVAYMDQVLTEVTYKERATVQVHKESMDLMEQYTEAMQAGNLAYANGILDRAVKIEDDIRLSMNRVNEYGKEAAKGISQDLETFFYDPAKEGLNGLLSSFIDTFRKIIANIAAQKAELALFGNFDAHGNSNGGLLSTVLNSLFSGFGSGGGGGGADITPVTIPAHAMGGAVFANQLSMVGEKGPELFMPGTNGTIVPNNALSSMSGKTGDVNYSPTMNFYSGTDDQLRRQLPSLLKQTHDQAISTMMDMKRRGKF